MPILSFISCKIEHLLLKGSLIPGDMALRGDETFATPGLANLFIAAVSLSPWEYAVLLLIAVVIFAYHILNCHIVGDILSGWPGDAIDLYYDSTSRVSAQLVANCDVLRQKYWPTPWLCSPHLQTLFLHFFGRSPRVEYQRELFITSDGGTIALDWVKFPTVNEDKAKNRQQNSAEDETPTAIIIPGLTSDSKNHYIKHMAGSFAAKGLRVLVANHRGLGGVSITSDQFYNAGFTEDLRKIILLVQQTYPKSPLLAVGTSVGANILVKYLGEEGSRTPLGGGVAICCPWDLLVCDRFMSRMGIQRVYNKALAFGLQQYAELHQATLSRIIDWDLLSKSSCIRDFDKNCTRLLGNFETVDTYYRRCSSTQFLGTVSIPLLCISAKDDPICTKEAIPYDECRVNPNVVLGVTMHGGHLGYFEGLNATSIWWVRATTEFARVLLSSSLMHQQSKVGGPEIVGASIDKAPFLTITDDMRVAAKASGSGSSHLNTTQGNQEHFSKTIQDNSWTNNVDSQECKSRIENPGIHEFKTDSHRDILTKVVPSTVNTDRVPATSINENPESQLSIKVQFRNFAEVAALRLALSQLLDQVPVSSVAEDSYQNKLVSGPEARLSTSRSSPVVEVPISSSVVKSFGNCAQAAKDILEGNNAEGKTSPRNGNRRTRKIPVRTEGDDSVVLRPLKKDMVGLASQNRRTLWLLIYVALVTSFPFLGSSFLVHTRGRVLDLLFHRWFKRIP